MKNYEEILKKICETAGPSGREYRLYPALKDIFSPIGDLKLSRLNNMYLYKEGKGKGSIMLMAHGDEIFLIVTDILEGGYLKFKSVGFDTKILPHQEVYIHGKRDIYGLIAVKPDEFKENPKNPIVDEDMFIDTGLSFEALKEIVSVGDFITIKREFTPLKKDKVSSKAIDDRAGILAMYVCAEELSKAYHDLSVCFAISCQEEVGCKGAKMLSYDFEPEAAFVIDVTYDSGKLGARDRENILGGGPVICIGPNNHASLRKKLMEVGKKNNIPYGLEVEPGNTGTDAWDIQVVKEGIPTVLVSIPEKYMHTSVETVDIRDIINTGKLIASFIKEVKSEELEGLLCF